ncbi:MAG: hypothetical protein ACPL6F_00420 [Anaerolineales bacterium]
MSTIAQMTKEELQQLIEDAVEKKLIELIGDQDKGMKLRQTFRQRLLNQRSMVINGERGKSLEEVIHHLSLE